MSREYQELLIVISKVFRPYRSDILPFVTGLFLGILALVVIYAGIVLSIVLR
jgi:hypothetical protein